MNRTLRTALVTLVTMVVATFAANWLGFLSFDTAYSNVMGEIVGIGALTTSLLTGCRSS